MECSSQFITKHLDRSWTCDEPTNYSIINCNPFPKHLPLGSTRKHIPKKGNACGWNPQPSRFFSIFRGGDEFMSGKTQHQPDGENNECHLAIFWWAGMKYEVPISPRKSHDENDGLSHDSTLPSFSIIFPKRICKITGPRVCVPWSYPWCR